MTGDVIVPIHTVIEEVVDETEGEYQGDVDSRSSDAFGLY